MLNTALLFNLLGFTIGIALYGLLLLMVVRHRRDAGRPSFDVLLFVAACLGLIWNLGEFVVFILKDLGFAPIRPILLAISYSALGFLPSVVVHSTWKSADQGRSRLFLLTIAAYSMSVAAGVLNIGSAIATGIVPSDFALRILTIGAIGLLVGLLAFAFRQALEKKAVWVGALTIFAFSALHLASHSDQSTWVVELVAHQSALPLALAILVQDYRFAFADLFLKRALSLMMLALVAFALYVWVAVPLLAWHETHDRNDVQAAVTVLALWIATALIYPKLHAIAEWFVDSVILRRTDFQKLLGELATEIEALEDIPAICTAASERLGRAVSAGDASWRAAEDAVPTASEYSGGRRAAVAIETVDTPWFVIELSDFAGGRNLLSGEQTMLESAAVMIARRIDSLRVTNERFEVGIREREFSKLAAEAQLAALRAQINPHFLFNSLTTVGYLIRSAPEKAFETLMKLTNLLRGVLGATGEFSSLDEEMKLIENYLDIEKARFEERLRVRIDVPPHLGPVRLPTLILQPLVENAIKHGISRNRNGGDVEIRATEETFRGETRIRLTVTDTGAGSAAAAFDHAEGIGLENIRQRLDRYYGPNAQITIIAEPEGSTRAEIIFPAKTVAKRAGTR